MFGAMMHSTYIDSDKLPDLIQMMSQIWIEMQKFYFKRQTFYNDSSENKSKKENQNIYVHIYTYNEYLKIVLKRKS